MMNKKLITGLLVLTMAFPISALGQTPSELDQVLQTIQGDSQQTELILQTPEISDTAATDDDFTVKDGEVVTVEEQELDSEAEDLAGSGGNMEQAYLKLIQKYMANEKDPDGLIRAAIAYDKFGNYGQAVSTLKRALKLDNKNKKIQNLLAEKWSRNGYKGFKVYVQGDEVSFDVQPQLIKDRTLIPIRKISESLGAAVDYKDGIVTIALNGKQIRLLINSTDATVDGTSVKLDVPATIVNDRTLVPLRFISENLDKTVDYAAVGDCKVISVATN